MVDFTLSNARQFYSSLGAASGVNGLPTYIYYKRSIRSLCPPRKVLRKKPSYSYECGSLLRFKNILKTIYKNKNDI